MVFKVWLLLSGLEYGQGRGLKSENGEENEREVGLEKRRGQMGGH